MPMPTAMAEALGYDEMGNAPKLLTTDDALAIWEGSWRRASGDVICRCGANFYSHPRCQGALWLVRTCEGLVKL